MTPDAPGRQPAPAPSNLLLLAPRGSRAEAATCVDLLLPTAPARTDVISVSLTQSPDERIARWRDHARGAAPARVALIAAGETTRSASASVESTAGAGPDETEVTVRSVPGPADLGALSRAIDESLGAMSGDGHRQVVCFHSVTRLLQTVELERVTAFLRGMTRLAAAADAVAHYHLDPSVDDAALLALEPLFDRTVDIATGGPRRPVAPARVARRNGGEEFRTRIGDDETPSEAVLRAVSTIEGTDPTELGITLFEAVDPEALDRLVTSASPAMDTCWVAFQFGPYRVTVDRELVTIVDLEPPEA